MDLVEKKKNTRLTDVQSLYIVYCGMLLDDAIETGERLDPKVFDSISRFLEKTGIKDSEPATMTPEMASALERISKIKQERD